MDKIRDVIEAAEWLAENRLDAKSLRELLPHVDDTPARDFLAHELESRTA